MGRGQLAAPPPAARVVRRAVVACAVAAAACRSQPVSPRPDLGDLGAAVLDLSQADLPPADLSVADLSSSDLSVGDLSRAPDLRTPTLVPVQIAVGFAASYARMSDGTVRAWGSNFYGELGDGTLTSTTRPQPVPGLSSVTQFAIFADHACVILLDRTLRCWGRNATGGIGRAPSASDPVVGNFPCGTRPTPVTGLGGVAEIGMGVEHTCARLLDGSVRCWGGNKYNQLDDGNTQDTPTPAVAQGLSGVTALGIGDFNGCAVVGGVPRCWGLFETPLQLPKAVDVPGIDSVVQVGAGSNIAHAFVRGDGTVAVSGPRFGTSAPDGGTGGPSLPRFVPGLVGVAEVTGSQVMIARFTDGHVASFDTDLVVRPVAGLSNIVQIAAGPFHFCALRNDGVVLCWGQNDEGQLGDGTTTNRAAPVPVQF
jgi:hypothetical protein